MIFRGCWPQLKTASFKRLVHVTPVAARYQINYNQLRDGNLANLASKDNDLLKQNNRAGVIENVKNVQGWHRGAERGFTAIYPDTIHILTNAVMKDVPDLGIWFRKVLTHNLSKSVVGQRYGILVPITYKQLCPNASKDQMNLAHSLGWCVELCRAAAIVTTETIAMDNVVRYGRTSKQKEKPTWADRHKLGDMAFNDALLIERGVFILLKHYFQESAPIFYDSILRALNSRVYGRALGYSIMDNGWRLDGRETNRLTDFKMTNYKALTRIHVSETNYCLPVSLALHLANLHDQRLHDLAHSILHEIGYYGEVTRDFSNCFVDQNGTDIQDGRLTSLIVVALQRGNTVQRKLLEENYGLQDPENVKIVKKVYDELKIKKTILKHIDEKKADIYRGIQGIAKLDEAGLSQEFFFKLLDNMDLNDIS